LVLPAAFRSQRTGILVCLSEMRPKEIQGSAIAAANLAAGVKLWRLSELRVR
jgi:hypothetical protein